MNEIKCDVRIVLIDQIERYSLGLQYQMSELQEVSQSQKKQTFPQGQDVFASLSIEEQNSSQLNAEESSHTEHQKESISNMIGDSNQYYQQINRNKSKKQQIYSKKKTKLSIKLLQPNATRKPKLNTNQMTHKLQHQELQQDKEDQDENDQKIQGKHDKKIKMQENSEQVQKNAKKKTNPKKRFSAIIPSLNRNQHRYKSQFTKRLRYLFVHHLSRLFLDKLNAHFWNYFPHVKTQSEFNQLQIEKKLVCLQSFDWEKIPQIPQQVMEKVEIQYPDESVKKSHISFFYYKLNLFFKVYYDTQLRKYQNYQKVDEKVSNYSAFLDNTGGKRFGIIMNQGKRDYEEWRRKYQKKRENNCDHKQSKIRQKKI